MKGKCNLCGKRHILPDGPPVDESPQYIYIPFAFHRSHPRDTDHDAGIYKVLQFPCYTTMISRPIFANLELIKKMEPVQEWFGNRDEWICQACIDKHASTT